MASRGSVIPLFLSQLRENKPLTVTDPKMTRFLMSLEDAVSLVLYAFNNGNQGDIFVQKAPARTIGDLTKALIELAGKENHQVDVIGTRHGEKLFESLISREEMMRAEDLGNHIRIRADNRDLNYEKFFTRGEKDISQMEDYTSHTANRLSVCELKQLLLGLDDVKGHLNV